MVTSVGQLDEAPQSGHPFENPVHIEHIRMAGDMNNNKLEPRCSRRYSSISRRDSTTIQRTRGSTCRRGPPNRWSSRKESRMKKRERIGRERVAQNCNDQKMCRGAKAPCLCRQARKFEGHPCDISPILIRNSRIGSGADVYQRTTK